MNSPIMLVLVLYSHVLEDEAITTYINKICININIEPLNNETIFSIVAFLL